MDELRRRVAKLMLEVGEEHGLALGGSSALSAHQIINRETKDVDGFINSFDPAVYDVIEKELVQRLEADGIDTVVTERNDFLRVVKATDRETGEGIVVDINYGHRDFPPVSVKDIGSVLDLNDIAAGKLIAFCQRRSAKDYLDLGAIISSKVFQVPDLVRILGRVSPATTADDLIAYLGDIDAYKDKLMRRYGLSLAEYESMRESIQGSIDNYRMGTTSAVPVLDDERSAVQEVTQRGSTQPKGDQCGR